MTIIAESFDQNLLIEQITVADEITITFAQRLQPLHALSAEPTPRGYKADTAGRFMIFPIADALFIWCYMSVASVVKRPLALVRSLRSNYHP